MNYLVFKDILLLILGLYQLFYSICKASKTSHAIRHYSGIPIMGISKEFHVLGN